MPIIYLDIKIYYYLFLYMNTIIKSGAAFVAESRFLDNNFDLTLDTNVNVKLEQNTRVCIGGMTYMIGPIIYNNPILCNRSITLEKETKYYINNREMDPIGLTRTLEHSQKFYFCCQTQILIPSETILHTLDNTLEFKLTKAIHCSLCD